MLLVVVALFFWKLLDGRIFPPAAGAGGSGKSGERSGPPGREDMETSLVNESVYLQSVTRSQDTDSSDGKDA